jgi:diguanylate cyclase (GGDEF)-like protein
MFKTSSHFTERLDALINAWAPVVPEHLRQSFRDAFRAFGDRHDEALTVIENAWKRRERDYTFDETGLARRGPFHEHLLSLLKMPLTPARTAIGILFIDVNHLKQINDSFGHEIGDRAIAAVGTILRDAVRARHALDLVAPTSPGETTDRSVSRHGGDEFLVALELSGPGDIAIVASRIKTRVEDSHEQRARGYGSPLPLTISVGAVVYALPVAPAPVPTPDLARTLIMAADEQMYASKRDGRVHIAFAEMTEAFDIDRATTRTLVL